MPESPAVPAPQRSMAEPQTSTLEVPGATLTYDVRTADEAVDPVPLLIIGSPMGAAGFGTLAGHFADRTVVTYDPRGVERSQRTDTGELTPAQHADDLHRLITTLGGGPVDIVSSSGGSVNALALVAQHPDEVRTLVAHEPPATSALPDRDPAMAYVEDLYQTYQQQGSGPAMAKFFRLVSHVGPFTEEMINEPVDPAAFGLPTEDDGLRDDPLLGQNMRGCNGYEHDYNALRSASTRIVPAVGVASAGTLCDRATRSIAERLDLEVVEFPGDHGGFLGGEYGQTGEPDAFAARLREIL